MARSFKLAFLCSWALLLPGADAFAAGMGQQASYYEWRDAHGTIHATAEPPAGRVATKLKVPAEPVVLPPKPVPSPPRLVTIRPDLEALQARDAYRHQSCRSARDEIVRLDREAATTGSHADDAAGRLAAQQRAQAKARARQRMLQYCGRP